LIERLRRENAELKESIGQLRRRVERLEARTRSGSIPARE
jgi:predicted RNase H-like nuclease (RuvC/YqgF family)